MRLFAPAKINLNLHVSAPIKEGAYKDYHNLDSLVMFANIGDYIKIEPANDLSLEIIGPFANELNVFPIENNLIIRAAKLLQNHCNVKKGAQIILEKNLPIASGIGGGSADCAATFNGLNKFWNLNLDIEELIEIGGNLGADIPICIKAMPAIMRSIGNIINDAPNLPKNIPAIIANPLLECPTPLIYKKYDENGIFSADMNFQYDKFDFAQIMQNTKNDLEEIAISLFPQIFELIENMKKLQGVEFVRMSGSGASVFAIFKDELSAIKGTKYLNDIYLKNGRKIWAHFCFLNSQNNI